MFYSIYIYAKSWVETVLLKISNEIKLQVLWEFLAVWLQSLLHLKKKKKERQRQREEEKKKDRQRKLQGCEF